MSKIIVAALYEFTALPEFQELQPPLKTLCDQEGIKGSLLLAPEGINGTVAGTRTGINKLHAFLETKFKKLEYKESWAEEMPFHRMKVRLKKEIVTLGIPGLNPQEKGGIYVNPEKWNDLISNPETLVLDTRNAYETEIGTFQGAVDPHTHAFTEFPAFMEKLNPSKDKPIAMFCTGGIRCEKASAYLRSQGYEKVYQLKGGILKYLETVSPDESLWKGECFVFDGRVSIDHDLELGHYELCHGCRHPINEEDKKSPTYERGVSCPYCIGSLSPEKARSARDRQRQEDLAHRRGQKHIGAVMPHS